MSDLRETLTQSGTLYGFINTIVYAHDYNDLSNKPQINGVTLLGNKTASELGLVTPSTEAVQSVNGETGAVVLDGNDIAYDSNNTINQQIDAVAASIPVVSYPVTSVNTKTGDVMLDGDDIDYAEGVTVNDQIGTNTADIGTNAANIGDLSTLTTSDKSSLVGAVNEVARYTPVYGNTASGSIATFDTSLALPLQDCTIEINAVQSGSGTPSPDNIRPITGFTECNVFVSGVNLWDEVWELGYISVANGTNSPSQINIRSKNYIPIKPNISLYLKANNNLYCPVIFYDKDKNFLSSINKSLWDRTITTPENAYYMRFYMHDSYGTTYNNDISINYPSTDTTYHKGASTTTTISLGQTVYGGELDVTSGKLTVTHVGYVVDGTRTILMSNANRFYIQIPNAFKVDSTNQTTYSGVRSEILSPTTWAGLGSVSGNLKCAPLYGNGIAFRDDEKTTVADWVTYFTNNPTIFTYELATPQTIQLTPTQVSAIVGTNNIFTDTNGNTSVVYACSLKDYIEGQ